MSSTELGNIRCYSCEEKQYDLDKLRAQNAEMLEMLKRMHKAAFGLDNAHPKYEEVVELISKVEFWGKGDEESTP